MPPNASTQRVAKAARNKTRRGLSEQRNIKFPVLIAVIVILGGLLVGFGRDRRVSSAATLPRLGQEHWHMPYEIFICDAPRPGLRDRREDIRGVHTHGADGGAPDGIIHLHPITSLASGKKADLDDFLYEVKLTVDDDKIEFPGGETFKNGQTCPDGRAGRVVLAKWQNVTEDAPPVLITQNIASTRFENDLMGFVIAFVPEGVELAKPSSAVNLSSLTDLPEGAAQPVTPTTAEQTGDTIVAGDGPSTTTVGTTAESTTTTAAPK